MTQNLLYNYNASEIEILEGLEPVRHRPGMYIGGTDNNALHHLVNEIIDNSMDEVVAKFATTININLLNNNTILSYFVLRKIKTIQKTICVEWFFIF